ncbi:hypothetical protein H6771_00975 [Candidatus Peribacteria bacterium]|nr:hypothetical protein [Candidatus Peribacteria bacterium]
MNENLTIDHGTNAVEQPYSPMEDLASLDKEVNKDLAGAAVGDAESSPAAAAAATEAKDGREVPERYEVREENGKRVCYDTFTGEAIVYGGQTTADKISISRDKNYVIVERDGKKEAYPTGGGEAIQYGKETTAGWISISRDNNYVIVQRGEKVEFYPKEGGEAIKYGGQTTADWIIISGDNNYVIVERDGKEEIYPIAGGEAIKYGKETPADEMSLDAVDPVVHVYRNGREEIYHIAGGAPIKIRLWEDEEGNNLGGVAPEADPLGVQAPETHAKYDTVQSYVQAYLAKPEHAGMTAESILADILEINGDSLNLQEIIYTQGKTPEALYSFLTTLLPPDAGKLDTSGIDSYLRYSANKHRQSQSAG